MSQPVGNESIEYERYVDGLRSGNEQLAEALRQIATGRDRFGASLGTYDALQELATNVIAETPPTGRCSRATRIITIHVEGGLVQDVTGIPAGIEVHVHDHDEGDPSHQTWDEEKKVLVTVYAGGGV